MTTAMKEMLHALATLLGADTYNGYLETRQPAPVPVPIRTDRQPRRIRQG